MARIEWWRGIIFEAELDCASDRLTRDFCYDTQTEIDSRRNSSGGDQVAIFYNSGLLVRRPEAQQEIRVSPMRCDSTPSEQTGGAKNERAGANGGHILCCTRPQSDKLDGLSIADRSDDALHAAGNADQIKGRTVRESPRRHEAEPAIAGHRSLRFGDDVGCRLRQPGEDLQRACKVELCQIGKNHEADIE